MVPDFDLGIGDSMGSDGKIDIKSVSVFVPDFKLGIGIGIG